MWKVTLHFMTERGEKYQQMILQFKKNQRKDYIKVEIEPTGPRRPLCIF